MSFYGPTESAVSIVLYLPVAKGNEHLSRQTVLKAGCNLMHFGASMREAAIPLAVTRYFSPFLRNTNTHFQIEIEQLAHECLEYDLEI